MTDDPYDLWNEPTARAWVQNVIEDMVPKLAGSAFAMSIVPDADDVSAGDVKYWVELGASIMMEKPIILLVTHGRRVPPKLAMIADEIVELPEEGFSEEGDRRIADALERVVKRLEADGGSDD